MNYYQEQIKIIAARVKAESADREIYDYIVNLVKSDMYSQSPKYKELWFLADASFYRGREWILKALRTREYHGIKKTGENILDLFLLLKRQMKEDRKNGLKLW